MFIVHGFDPCVVDDLILDSTRCVEFVEQEDEFGQEELVNLNSLFTPQLNTNRIEEVLEQVGMGGKGYKMPNELSGGEQQRVAIARALINRPALLLADEPSGNLDTKNRDEIHSLFFRLRDELGQTTLIVTHDEGLAAMADRKISMIDGKIL